MRGIEHAMAITLFNLIMEDMLLWAFMMND